ncbi:MAG: 3'-5' exonuclease, partial [Pseudomonadota bacterium]
VLWLELKRRSETGDGLARQACDARTALQTALDAGARRGPYALLTTMLERGGETTGRQRLAQRLGNGYRDAVGALLDAALTYEEGEPRSIHGFLHHTEKLRAEIKRDPAGDGDAGVRVMTVHGAKGLEAPIVYLADADYLKKPSDIIRSDPIVLVKPQNLDFSVPILLPQSSDQDSRETAALRLDEVDRHYEEYQRLLYVAATRAQESLIVCGGANDKGGKTWHRLIGEGFDKLAESGAVVERVPSPEDVEGERLVYANKAALPDAELEPQPVDPAAAIPDWLYQQAEPEAANPVIYPSLAGEDDDASDGRFVLAAPSSSDARKRGLLIHRLLELLPSRPEETWAEDAQHLVASARQQLGDEECAEIIRAALDFLRNPQYKDLFSAESRAEVAIQGQIGKSTVSGVIDRLVVSPGLVTIAEFKTSRWIPASPSDIPEPHRRQAEIYGQLVSEIYPGRGVRSLLIYTTAPKVFDLSKDCVP